MVHPAMAGPHARVLILGGGDGLAAREVLRHPGVRRVDVVDLDPAVVRLARTDPALTRLNGHSYDDPRVRRALNHAIPVETIAERVFFGFAKASDAPLAFDTQGYQKQRPYEYSVAKAKALLAEAGFKPGAGGQLERDGKPLGTPLFTGDAEHHVDLSTTTITMSTQAATRRCAGRVSTDDTHHVVHGDPKIARRVLDALVITP